MPTDNDFPRPMWILERYWDWKAFGSEFALTRDESFKVWYYWRLIHSMYTKWEHEKREEASEGGSPKGGGKGSGGPKKRPTTRRRPVLPSRKGKR